MTNKTFSSRTLLWAALAVVLLAVAGIYLRDSLFPGATPTPRVPATPTETVVAVALTATPTPVPTGAAAPTADPGAIADRPTPTRFFTPTPEPGGQVLLLQPHPGEAGWWVSSEERGNHLGDSFLYAGFYDNQVFIAAARFDLARIPRGAPIRQATLRLTGLNAQRFDEQAAGAWSVQLLASDTIPDLARADFQTIFNAAAPVSLFPMLTANDLQVGHVNTWDLDAGAQAWLSQQIINNTGALIVRIVGPAGGGNSLFAWDSGGGPASTGNGIHLLLNLGPPPATPPPAATRSYIVATLPPTPANILTVAANALTATSIAASIGTYTPTPFNLVTPTPTPRNQATAQAQAALLGLPPVVIPTSVPANGATATYQAAYATAVTIITGTLTPIPTNAITPIIVRPTAIPENVLTVAAQVVAATARARTTGTPTPFPYSVAIATVTPFTPAPLVVTSTPTPLTFATSVYRSAQATAVALTTGTYTPLPYIPITPTPLPLLVYLDRLTPTAQPTATPTVPAALPRAMIGNIIFRSDRQETTEFYMLDLTASRLVWVTQAWPFNLAQRNEMRSSNGRYRVLVQNDAVGVPQVFVQDAEFNNTRQITNGSGWSFDPAFSPRGDRIAYVSQNPGNDEIYTIGVDGSDMRRLTSNSWEWDKHPSWSPDGSQIVFWSNRDTGRRQLWIMNADGSNQRLLIGSPYQDWDPIWMK